MDIPDINKSSLPTNNKGTLVDFCNDDESSKIFAPLTILILKKIAESDCFSDNDINYLSKNLLIIKSNFDGKKRIKPEMFIYFMKKGGITDNQILNLSKGIKNAQYKDEVKELIINLVKKTNGNRGKLYKIVYTHQMKTLLNKDIRSFITSILFSYKFDEENIGNIILGFEKVVELITKNKTLNLSDFIEILLRGGYVNITQIDLSSILNLDPIIKTKISKLITSHKEKNLTETHFSRYSG